MRAKRSRPLLVTLGFMASLPFLPTLHTADAREGASRSRGQVQWEGLRAGSGEAYARTTHVMRTRVGARLDGSKLELVKLTYAGSHFDGCFGAMGLSSVARAGLDTDGDGRVDEDVRHSLRGLVVVPGNATLFLSFDGSIFVREGDMLELAYEDVVNPAAGSYRVEVTLNPGPSEPPQLATLEVQTSANIPPACTDGAERGPAPSAAPARSKYEL